MHAVVVRHGLFHFDRLAGGQHAAIVLAELHGALRRKQFVVRFTDRFFARFLEQHIPAAIHQHVAASGVFHVHDGRGVIENRLEFGFCFFDRFAGFHGRKNGRSAIFGGRPYHARQ